MKHFGSHLCTLTYKNDRNTAAATPVTDAIDQNPLAHAAQFQTLQATLETPALRISNRNLKPLHISLATWGCDNLPFSSSPPEFNDTDDEELDLGSGS